MRHGTSALGTTSGEDLVEILRNLGIPKESIQGEITDFGSWMPHIDNYLAHNCPNITAIHCIDPQFQINEVANDVELRFREVLEGQKWEMSHPLDGMRHKIAKNAMLLLSIKGLNPKIDYYNAASLLPDGSQSVILGTYLMSNADFCLPLVVEFTRLLKNDGVVVLTDHRPPSSDFSAWTTIKKFLQENDTPIPVLVQEKQKDYHIESIVLRKKDLVTLQQKINSKIGYTGIKKITIQHQGWLDDQVLPYEYGIISYKQIGKGLLTPEECTVLENLGFRIENFMHEFSNGDHMCQWEEDRENTPAKNLGMRYLIFYEEKGKYLKCDFDEEIYAKIAEQIQL